MRRKQCEIGNRKTIDTILKRCTIGRLATVGKDGYPYITPVNYVYSDGSIYFHSAPEGEKIDNIRENSRVCFEVDIPLSYLDLACNPTRPVCQLHQFYHCVILRGRAEIITNISEKVRALNALVAAHEQDVQYKEVSAETKAVQICSVIAVRIERISGKSDLAQKKSLEEKRRLSVYLRKRNLPGDEEVADLFLGDL